MQAQDTELDLTVTDLGPLAWVLDELRKSLEASFSALRRFQRDLRQSRSGEEAAAEPDPAPLRIARQHLHQSVGALDMVGLGAPAQMLRAMEAAAQKFVDKPELCDEAAGAKVERAGYALLEFLEALLLGRKLSAVSLFPQYREVQSLSGADRVHPADLWSLDWRWHEPRMPMPPHGLPYAPAVRTRMDQAVLRIVKSGDAQAASDLSRICLGLGVAQQERQARIFWKVCCGYFEALALGLLPADLYVKRAASRVLLQYAQLAKGEAEVSERLTQDLLFFCAQSMPADPSDAPLLHAVREAWGLVRFTRIDYEQEQFGRFEPALLSQLRKRIVAAKELWSQLAGGEAPRQRGAADPLRQLCEALVRLHPSTTPLAEALSLVGEDLASSHEPPGPELAMEVATALLYLEAAFQDLDADEGQLAERASRLAARLSNVRQHGAAEALEPWMEVLYRRVSDRQTIGSVVGELRTTLGELEKELDTFFRSPQDLRPLQAVPGRLSQMRGVLSVLGLDHAAHAVQRMRSAIDARLAAGSADDADAPTLSFETLGHNLGALGFMIDMLNYQPVLAKKLFVFNEASGELRPLMGRAAAEDATASPVDAELTSDEGAVVPTAFSLDGVPAPDLDMSAAPIAQAAPEPLEVPELPVLPELQELPALPEIPELAAPADAPEPAPPVAAAAPVPPAQNDVDEELLSIFLDEAREVVQSARSACEAVTAGAAQGDEATVLRRAFHTLKGSSRMVGLNEFGEAAWAMEQLLNAWLADNKPATPILVGQLSRAIEGLGRWTEAIASRQDAGWQAAMFRVPADAFRENQEVLPFAFPDEASSPAQDVAPPAEETCAVEVSEVFDGLPLDGPVETIELSDFASLDEVPVTDAAAPEAIEPAAEVPQPEAVDLAPELPEPELPESETAAPVFELQDEPAPIDEQVKVIGPLRIGIPLYNVYLNEADEWSRHLQTELSEWAMELTRPLPDSTVQWAHSLAGSSATVGFDALSGIARALEHSLQRTQRLAWGTQQHAQAYNDAAEEIRRLLHQFAAGFLKEPDPALLEALLALETLEVPLRPPVAEPEPDVQPASEPAKVFVLPTEDTLVQDSGFGELAAPLTFEPPSPATEHPHEPAPIASLDDQREGIDVTDAVDVDLFPIFEEEAMELLPQLGGALRQWNARPDNQSARDAVLRVLHTLKGSARLAGALRLGEMAHRMESVVEVIGSQELTAQDIEPLVQRFDALQSTFDALCQAHAQREADALAAATPAAEQAAATSTALAAVPSAAEEAAPLSADATGALLAPPVSTSLAAQRTTATQGVRVRSQLLDRLMNQAGEVMITRSRLETELRQLRVSLGDLTGNLERLRAQLRDVELQAETQMQSRLAQSRDSAGFDPLEFDRFTRMQELTRMMAESVNDVATVQRTLQRTVEATEDDLAAQARQTRELQRDLLRTRMVEFEAISDRLYRVVRQASKDSGKQVKLDIDGGRIEMDRGVLDRMTPAFEHLLRNCVAHGIEDAGRRTAAGKGAVGRILVLIQQEGNDVSVEFQDDGAGLDLARIRERAVQQQLVAADLVMDDAEAADLIFTPGFSTAREVTELAGRGVGLDVVRAEVNALGGRIETHNHPGQGTRFKLVLPLTTAVTQVVMVRSGSLTFGVPANLIELVRRAAARDVQQAYNNSRFEHGGEQLPFFWSGALLQTSRRSSEPQGKTLPVVIVRSAAQRIAVHVDEVLGSQEVVVKNLGPQLARLPGLAAMTVLPSGAVVLVYNPVALANVYGETARRISADQAEPQVLEQAGLVQLVTAREAAAQVPLVLVVDDSITVRRVTQRLLQREGWRVALAVDGLQALEKLADETPALVLSDIEMPRMDGFDLARNIRSDARWAKLPIVMITSRIAEKHREHARELGVNHYLGKPYSEEELLRLVKRYCMEAAEA